MHLRTVVYSSQSLSQSVFVERSFPHEFVRLPRPFPPEDPSLAGRSGPADRHRGVHFPGALGRDLRCTGPAHLLAGVSGAGRGPELSAAGGRRQLAHRPQPPAPVLSAPRHRQRMDGHLRQCGGPRRGVCPFPDVVSPPPGSGRRPGRRPHDPAICLSQNGRSALHHPAASGRPPLAGGPLGRRAAVSARSLRRGGRGHRGADRPGGCCISCPTQAAGPSAGPTGSGSWTP